MLLEKDTHHTLLREQGKLDSSIQSMITYLWGEV